MSRRREVLGAVGLWLIALTAPGLAEEKPVVDEILEILREGGQIDDKKYDELRRRLEDERSRQSESGETGAEVNAPEKKKGEPGFSASCKDGLRFSTEDGNFDCPGRFPRRG